MPAAFAVRFQGGDLVYFFVLSWALLTAPKSSNAATPIPMQAGIYNDGRHNIRVQEIEDPTTFVKWLNILVEFGSFGFYVNPRSGEASDLPYVDPRDPTPHAPIPYHLQKRVDDDQGHYLRWRQGGLLKTDDNSVEIETDPQGQLTALRVVFKKAVFGSRRSAFATTPQIHSGPWKRQWCAYNCENVKPGYDKSLDPEWFKNAFARPGCSAYL